MTLLTDISPLKTTVECWSLKSYLYYISRYVICCCFRYVNLVSLCEGIGTDVPDSSANAIQPDGFYDGHVEHGLKGQSKAAKPSPQNQPSRPPQMNVGAGNHPFPKSFLDGDFEFVCFSLVMFILDFTMVTEWGQVIAVDTMSCVDVCVVCTRFNHLSLQVCKTELEHTMALVMFMPMCWNLRLWPHFKILVSKAWFI